jgi:hypothetical protein
VCCICIDVILSRPVTKFPVLYGIRRSASSANSQNYVQRSVTFYVRLLAPRPLPKLGDDHWALVRLTLHVHTSPLPHPQPEDPLNAAHVINGPSFSVLMKRKGEREVFRCARKWHTLPQPSAKSGEGFPSAQPVSVVFALLCSLRVSILPPSSGKKYAHGK